MGSGKEEAAGIMLLFSNLYALVKRGPRPLALAFEFLWRAAGSRALGSPAGRS